MSIRIFLNLLKLTIGILLLASIGLGLYIGWIYMLQKHENKAFYGQLSIDHHLNLPDTFSTAHFNLIWSGTDGVIKITQGDHPQKVIWSTLPGVSFINGALTENDMRESRGSYHLKSKWKARYPLQTIDQISIDNDTIFLRGKIENSSTGSSVAYQMAFNERDDQTLSFQINTTSPEKVNRLHLTYASSKTEQFFGFGTQYSFTNLKGKRLPVFVSEQGIGRGKQPLTFLVDLVAQSGGTWSTSYAPVPHYITSKMNSLYLTTYHYSVFDLRSMDRVQITTLDDHLSGCILAGSSPAELIEEYTRYSGRMSPLPDWINEGAVIGLQGGTQRLLDIHKKLIEADVPVAAYWIQDWVGQRLTSFGKQLWWNWELDTNHYHDWEKLRKSMELDSIRLMGYINPFLVDVRDKENVRRNLLEEATQLDLLVKDSTGNALMVMITDFSAAILDLTNPRTRAWIKDVIQKGMMEEGFSGWMADFGEALPLDATLFDSSEAPEDYHNRYPEEWAKLNGEAIREIDSTGQYVYFNRSGYSLSPGYGSLFWLGDQLVTWDRYDGLKTAIMGLMSSGLSGYALNHSDIGGYTALTNKPLHIVRSKELLMRWAELNAFTAVFRTHEGNRPDENAQIYDDETLLHHFSKMAKIYTALAPYRKKLMEDAASTGLPLVRHPFIHYPEELHFYQLKWEQFMLGEDVMVAPVANKGSKVVEIFLPADKWTHAFTGEVVHSHGQYYEMDAPLGCPAVFIRGESNVLNLLKDFHCN